MNKTLMIAAVLGLSSVAFAQTTTQPATPAAPATTETAPAETRSPQEHFARAQEMAAQAEIAYPVAFADRILWKAALAEAYAASSAEPNNRQYTAYLGQLYTTTQWWINGYNTWLRLGDLNEQERQWAALTAAKLAYLRLQAGDRAGATAYINQGLQWAQTPSLLSLQQAAAR
ncbi:hypothetical protein HNR42_002680 [Deinobacterium chartae]|uniref:Uncharacterized protein n=1 Tax=Deinobacterium chartae TaxID=521158 RepID=A0A841I5N2_9DEIO|nr:hypothetical protein [Deinobacterium chartae]MBB6099242.1 hypothetical protein [Deinobacterium chartae]